jgi:hypothetical protein
MPGPYNDFLPLSHLWRGGRGVRLTKISVIRQTPHNRQEYAIMLRLKTIQNSNFGVIGCGDDGRFWWH